MIKKIALIITVCLIALITGCGNNKDVAEEKVPGVEKEQVVTEKEEPIDVVKEELVEEIIEEEPVIDLTGMAINPLTGLYIDEEVAERRPIGIMINNLKAAMPQSGIGQADVIYETLVEGGICRLFAIFQDFDGTKIGPVRSARHYFLDFAFDFDALYMHYGMSPQAQVAIANLNPADLDGLSGLDTIMCFQDPNRKRPHSTYTSYDGLMAGWDSKGYRETIKEDLVHKFNFASEVVDYENGQLANKVILDYSYYQYAWFEYDDETQLYNRFQFDKQHIDVETGEQLAFDNIIVQFTDIWQISGDTEGRLDMDLSTTGTGYYITRGEYIPITWSKESHYDPTLYYNEEGNQLDMNTGKTWISVFPSNRADKLIIE